MMLLAIPAALDGAVKILVFLLMLSVLIVLHEGGHFLMARRAGVRVNDFAVGFGPTLLKWTSPRSGTNYRINLLPIGGYCAMFGEDGRTSEAEQQRSFQHEGDAVSREGNFQGKSPWARLAIVLAGPIANLVLAFAILLVAALTFGVASSEKPAAVVGPLKSGGYPAERAGLRMGDRIVSIDGLVVKDGEEMIGRIHASPNRTLTLVYQHHGESHQIRITPRREVMDGKVIGLLGFSAMPLYQRVGLSDAVKDAWEEYTALVTGNASNLAKLIRDPKAYAPQMSGVIGMERAASQVQEIGWGPYLHLAAAISVALGVLNLLPLPALDGGRAIFILAELLRGRPVDPEKEALVHVTGFALLMALMVVVAYHDIANIVAGKEPL